MSWSVDKDERGFVGGGLLLVEGLHSRSVLVYKDRPGEEKRIESSRSRYT